MTTTMDALLRLFDERGTLVGTILRPVSCDPVGAGRETVYLARAACAAVASPRAAESMAAA